MEEGRCVAIDSVHFYQNLQRRTCREELAEKNLQHFCLGDHSNDHLSGKKLAPTYSIPIAKPTFDAKDELLQTYCKAPGRRQSPLLRINGYGMLCSDFEA